MSDVLQPSDDALATALVLAGLMVSRKSVQTALRPNESTDPLASLRAEADLIGELASRMAIHPDVPPKLSFSSKKK